MPEKYCNFASALSSLTTARTAARFSVMLCAVLGVLASFTEPVRAQEAGHPGSLAMQSFFIQTVPHAVRVDSGFTLDNSAPIRAQLRDGAQMILVCKLRLERLRSVLSNVTVSETRKTFHLRHDPLLRDFMLFTDATPPLRDKKLDVLLDSLKTIRFSLPLQEPLEPGETYRITINVTLQHAKVPPWLEQALFFWSWDVVPPLTYTQEFTF